MNQTVLALSLPAKQEYALVARMAMGGLGMLEGLDVDAIGDLQTVTNECFDCLIHQSRCPDTIAISAKIDAGRLSFCYQANGGEEGHAPDLMDLEITRGVLETLVCEVELQTDAGGVQSITCFMPI